MSHPDDSAPTTNAPRGGRDDRAPAANASRSAPVFPALPDRPDLPALEREMLVRWHAAAGPGRPSRAQQRRSDETLRIGILHDMSGAYRDISGPTSVACARQAIREFRAAMRVRAKHRRGVRAGIRR